VQGDTVSRRGSCRDTVFIGLLSHPCGALPCHSALQVDHERQPLRLLAARYLQLHVGAALCLLHTRGRGCQGGAQLSPRSGRCCFGGTHQLCESQAAACKCRILSASALHYNGHNYVCHIMRHAMPTRVPKTYNLKAVPCYPAPTVSC